MFHLENGISINYLELCTEYLFLFSHHLFSVIYISMSSWRFYRLGYNPECYFVVQIVAALTIGNSELMEIL